jgi:DNA (cytosine-5)-methyltransferase 1
MNKLNYIDLFAGCGGLSLGLHNAGWKGLFAIEKSPDAFKTLSHNLIENKNHFEWVKWLPKKENDIKEVLALYKTELKALQGEVTLIAGGPPCQGFSMAGRRNENDERNDLINSYIDFVELVQPKIILFENVKGFTLEFVKNKEKGIAYSSLVTQKLQDLGYYVKGKLVNFGDYGVPQKRTRFILIGLKYDLPYATQDKVDSFFHILEESKFDFFAAKHLTLKPTVGNAISDLLKRNGIVKTPDRAEYESSIYGASMSPYQIYQRKGITSSVPDSHSFAKHTPAVLDRLSYILSVAVKNKNINEELRAKYNLTKQVIIPLSPDEQSPTLTSHPDDLIHFCEPRILTVREYARIQSFPDWYEFKGKYTTGGHLRKIETPRYTQIGNAIPPLFGELAGVVLKQMLEK